MIAECCCGIPLSCPDLSCCAALSFACRCSGLYCCAVLCFAGLGWASKTVGQPALAQADDCVSTSRGHRDFLGGMGGEDGVERVGGAALQHSMLGWQHEHIAKLLNLYAATSCNNQPTQGSRITKALQRATMTSLRPKQALLNVLPVLLVSVFLMQPYQVR